MRFWQRLGVLGVSCVIAGCGTRADAAATNESADASATPAVASAGVIDSALPMDVLLDRFRRDIPRVETLHGDVSNRDALVRAVVTAMADSNAVALEQLAVNLGEFAWLYFPTARVALPPYEVPPALAWFQVQEKNRRGALRAIRELGGHRVVLNGYRCDAEATREGQNRIWTGCRVNLSRDGAAPVELRLFGAVLERDGRLGVLSYENDF